MQLLFDGSGIESPMLVDVPPRGTVADLQDELMRRLSAAGSPAHARPGLSFLGKRLRSSQHVDSVGFQHGSRVEASGRLRGGGGDGGSTGAESRSSYLEMYMEKKADQVDPAQARLAKWSCCSFTGHPLEAPLVSDEYGSLFNKLEMFQGLKDCKAGLPWPPNLAHITRMKDLIPVKAHMNSNYTSKEGQASERPDGNAPLECPLLNTPLNGRGKAVLHRHTGLIMTEKGMSQAPAFARDLIQEAAAAALEAGAAGVDKVALERAVAEKGAWDEGDLIVVNPEGADAEAAQYRTEKIVARRAKHKDSSGKSGKRAAATPAEFTVGGKRAKTSLLDSLFHEDGGGAVIKETFCCRSIGARGMHLT